MMRKCHMNTCPVGVATQDKRLRKLFTGKPEHVVNFFIFLATEMREIMAELGFKTVNEMVGKVDVLKVREDIESWKVQDLDLSTVLHRQQEGSEDGIYHRVDQHHEIDFILDQRLIDSAGPALDNQMEVRHNFRIVNTDRAVGAMLSHEISKRYKGEGLPANTIHFNFKGSAGQSFAAFLAPGATFELEGEANDYFGKGLSGGELIVYPHRESSLTPEENQLIGNVAFYGATSGNAYINGLAGERFCVRNSGVNVVVEGVGDHGCEYMTGGNVVILGPTGRNFAAGMSGGTAYIYDPKDQFSQLYNPGMVDLEEPEEDDIEIIESMIGEHIRVTDSPLAKRIMDNWNENRKYFVKVMPRDYKKALQKQKRELKEAI